MYIYRFFLIFIFFFSFIPYNWAIDPNKKDTALFIKVYHIQSDFTTDSTNKIDTSLKYIHYLNYLMPDYDSYTSLSRSGFPFVHNNLYLRFNNNDYFFPAISFDPLLQNTKNSSFYYDSNKPFSSISYKFLGRLQSKEEFVEASHFRRVSKTGNIGITYRLFSNKSENDFQHANDHSFLVYFKNAKPNTFRFYQFYFNSFDFTENGGIVSDSLIDYRNNDFYGTEVNLKNNNSKIVQWGGQLIQQVKFNKIFKSIADSSNLSAGNFTYRIMFQNDKKAYFSTFADTLYYKNYYSKTGSLADSLKLIRLYNQFQLALPNISKYFPNLRVAISHAFYHSFNGNNTDTLYFNNIENNRYQNHQQTWVTSMADYSLKKFKISVLWDSYIYGYGIGDQCVTLNSMLGNVSDTTNYFKLKVSSSLKTPSFFYQSVFLNNYIWNKGDSLRKIKQQEISTLIYVSNLKTLFSLNYILLKDFVYFDFQGLLQSSKIQHILVYQLKNQFSIGKFVFNNLVTYQMFDKNYFHVPSLILFHSSEFWHTFRFSTGGKLSTRLGMDIKFVTSYKPDTYLPPLGVFALTPLSDNSVFNTSEFPVVSFNLSFKVKNVSFYVKYHHASAWLYTRNFTAAHYPMVPAEISYGIRWLFYD